MTIIHKTLLFVFLLLNFSSCIDDDAGPLQTNNFRVTIENVIRPKLFFQGGQMAVPVGTNAEGSILPGGAYEFTIQAGPNVLTGDGGTRLTFATMFVQSNDIFIAPDASGIELYDDSGIAIGVGTAVDVSDQMLLWDAGTEVNELTGSPSQKPQQDSDASDIGTDENGVVTQIVGNSDGVNVLPDATDVIKVTILNRDETEFLVRVENVSDTMTIATPALGVGTTAAVPLSPIVYAVHTADNPFFIVGDTASVGIEDIAEDGFIAEQIAFVNNNTGLITPLSPGVWAVHDENTNALFEVGASNFGVGLEAIAEDGDPSELAPAVAFKSGVISSAVFNTPVAATAPSPILPGSSYIFDFTASSGDRLTFATKFVQSNDWFYSFVEEGIPLFINDIAVTGDVSDRIVLYDAGTEAEEFPGAGMNQVIRQAAPNTGPSDANTNVRVVTNTPANIDLIPNIIRVTISTQ